MQLNEGTKKFNTFNCKSFVLESQSSVNRYFIENRRRKLKNAVTLKKENSDYFVMKETQFNLEKRYWRKIPEKLLYKFNL